MPSRSRRKYTQEQEGSFKVAILDALGDAEIPMTIPEIKEAEPIVLSEVTSQKIARILNEFADAGLVKKGKSNAKKRMVYILVANLDEQEDNENGI